LESALYQSKLHGFGSISSAVEDLKWTDIICRLHTAIERVKQSVAIRCKFEYIYTVDLEFFIPTRNVSDIETYPICQMPEISRVQIYGEVWAILMRNAGNEGMDTNVSVSIDTQASQSAGL
jgi:hypothetical protein